MNEGHVIQEEAECGINRIPALAPGGPDGTGAATETDHLQGVNRMAAGASIAPNRARSLMDAPARSGQALAVARGGGGETPRSTGQGRIARPMDRTAGVPIGRTANRPAGPLTWEPSIPLDEIAPECLEKAAKLQRALQPTLLLGNDPARSATDLESMASRDYTAVFGHAVSPRYIRELLKRTRQRAGAGADFAPLALYLDDRLARKQSALPVVTLATEKDFHVLHTDIAGCASPLQLTPAEKAFLWERFFVEFERVTGNGRNPKKVRQSLLAFIGRHVPGLVAPGAANAAESLRVQFHTKYKSWQDNGRSPVGIFDRRAVIAAPRAVVPATEDDLGLIKWESSQNYGGRISQAIRELAKAGKLSAQLSVWLATKITRKGDVPRALMQRIKTDVRILEPYRYGPHQVKMQGPHLQRSYDGTHAGDWYQADDFTMPVYFIGMNEHGETDLIRGQILVMVDIRSRRVLGFCLIPARNYNSLAIRTLITKVCEEHGLPRKGFYFERGMWKTARVIKGMNRVASAGSESEGSLSEAECKYGLRAFGLQFEHATEARQKVVEGIGGTLQNLMEGCPGYCGRDEKKERFEKLQDLMQGVRSGKVDPARHFLTLEQWNARFNSICENYNAEPQDGKMLDGLSPDAAFQGLDDPSDPPIKFPAELRRLFSHVKFETTVNKNGVVFSLAGKSYVFRDDETSAVRGQQVRVWFDPELPDTIVITDLKDQNPRLVQRSNDVPNFGAPAEVMAREMRLASQHQSHGKTLYSTLKAKFARPFRAMVADRETVELCTEMNEQKAALDASRQADEKVATQTRRVAQKMNLRLSPEQQRDPDTLATARRLNELLAADSTPTQEPHV